MMRAPWHPNDDEHAKPPPPTPEWRRLLELNRRRFLKISLGSLGLGFATGVGHTAYQANQARQVAPVDELTISPPDTDTDLALTLLNDLATHGDEVDLGLAGTTQLAAKSPILVVVQLSGGNDGLNTVVPYSNDAYYKNRTTLAIPEAQVLKLNDTIGFHPNLARFKRLWDRGKVTLIQGVGYPQPNRSHFRSMDIYHTAEPVKFENYGWLGKYLDVALADSQTPFKAINVGASAPKALWARRTPAASLRDISAFNLLTNRRYDKDDRDPLMRAFSQMIARPATTGAEAGGDPIFELINQHWTTASAGAQLLRDATNKYVSQVKYPVGAFGGSLQTIASLIHADLGTRVFHTQLGGFDDHSAQKNVHDRLIAQVGDGLAAFWEDIEGLGAADRVLVLVFSEFGRRVRENASAGTDHGAAQPLFIIGGNVAGGVIGEHPSLSTLDDGDLIASVDFRAVYHNILTEWLKVPGQDIVGGAWERLGLFRA